MWDVGVTLLRGVVEDGAQQTVPARRGGDLKQTYHAVAKCLKVKHVVDPRLSFHVGKVSHAEDSINEHDQEEEESNVEESRKGHHEGEK